MPVEHGLGAHCLELLSSLGPTRARRMFGGHGRYAGEHFVALDQPGAALPEGRRDRAPDEALESPAAMQPWASLAMASALRAAAARRPAKPRTPAAKARRTASPQAKPPPAKSTPELRDGHKEVQGAPAIDAPAASP